MTATPLFTKTFDFITWLVERSNHFPRSQRFVVTKRMLDAALNFQEHIVEANSTRGRARIERMHKADAELDKVRLYIRMAFRWKWFSDGQYRHASGFVAEIGKLLGGWKKKTSK
jgi:four helix bundle protein